MSESGKAAATARTEGAPTPDRTEATAATTARVDSAAPAAAAEPSAARLGTPYQGSKRKERHRRN
jgi:hypothetical protein